MCHFCGPRKVTFSIFFGVYSSIQVMYIIKCFFTLNNTGYKKIERLPEKAFISNHGISHCDKAPDGFKSLLGRIRIGYQSSISPPPQGLATSTHCYRYRGNRSSRSETNVSE